MRKAARYRFTLFWASVLVGLGVGVMAMGVLAAGLLVLLPGRVPIPDAVPDVLASAVVLVCGFLVGGPPLVLTGQLVQVFLDQRQLLASIQRSLRRWRMSGRPSGTTPCGGLAARCRAGVRTGGRFDPNPPGRGAPPRRQGLAGAVPADSGRGREPIPPGPAPLKSPVGIPGARPWSPRNRRQATADG